MGPSARQAFAVPQETLTRRSSGANCSFRKFSPGCGRLWGRWRFTTLGKEDVLTTLFRISEKTTELGPCTVRSGTYDPCPRPASVKLLGVPFCEECAREQEAYFAIGEMSLN